MKKFCHLCGSPYKTGTQQPWECSGCGNLSFTNANPTVELALFDDRGRILLAKRAIEPNKGLYDLPGGFISLHETAEEAVAREVLEELQLTPDDYTKPIFACSWVGTGYVYSKESHVTLNLVFTARLKTKQPSAQDDVAALQWIDIHELKDVSFSFKSYPEIIAKAYNVFKSQA